MVGSELRYFVPLFIFPPFNKIILKYVSSKQSDVSLGEIGAADFLGPRKDTDKEQARLYRALARSIQRYGLGGLQSKDRLAIEIQRYHSKQSQDSQQERELRTRICTETQRGSIATLVGLLLQGNEGDTHHQNIEGTLDLIDSAEAIALNARKDIAKNDDLSQMPWIHLGPRALHQGDESKEARIERFVSCDVVLFLWVLTLIASQSGWRHVDIAHYIPNSYEDLGKVWFQKLNSFAKTMHTVEETQSSHLAPYKKVAAFLVSGDPDGGPIETLSEELSAIVRGKKRLTNRVVERHTRCFTEALKCYWNDQPDKHALAEDFGSILLVHGQILGLLQYAHAVALSDVRQECPSANIDAAFDAGLACWPKLVEWAHI
jgi:hypothetical protein